MSNGPAVYFPRAGDQADALLAQFIEADTNRLYLAIYALNNQRIAGAIALQRARGIDVRLITDHLQASNASQVATLKALQAAGVPIKCNHHAGLMHMKMAVRGNPPNGVALGSFNWTNNAETLNDEVLAMIEDEQEAWRAADVFECMWMDTARFVPWRPPTPKEMHAAMSRMPEF